MIATNFGHGENIISMDCLEFLASLQHNSVDLIVADPPYNMKKGDWDTFGSDNDFLDWTFKWIKAAFDVLKPDGSIYVFNTPYNCARILPYMCDLGLTFQNWITWDKRDGMSGAKRKFVPKQESILFFTKGTDHTFNYDDIRVPYDTTEDDSRFKSFQNIGILKNGKRYFPHPDGKLCTDVWHVVSERHKNKVNGKTVSMGHATPKPLEMIERIIKASSNEGDLVVDPFSGTGTTAVAAKKLNRKFVCADINEEYNKIAEQRLKELPDTLFV